MDNIVLLVNASTRKPMSSGPLSNYFRAINDSGGYFWIGTADHGTVKAEAEYSTGEFPPEHPLT